MAANLMAPYVSKAMPSMYTPPAKSMYPGPQGTSNRIMTRDTYRRANRAISTNKETKLTPDGLSFLKCAFAPPDFATTNVKGVPDSYQGESFVTRFRLTENFTNPAGRDTYIWLCPVPGVAYAVLNKASGVAPVAADIWLCTPYPNYTGFYGTTPQTVADQVTRFRMVSNHLELVPTVNATKWSGSIQAFKAKITLTTRTDNTSITAGGLYTYTGMQAVNALNSNAYSSGVNNGIYVGAYSRDCQFNWNPLFESGISLAPLPIAIVPGDFTQLSPQGVMTNIPGFDTGFESAIIRITNDGSGANTFIARAYSCVEFQVQPLSVLAQSTVLTAHDPLAIELYKKCIHDLPVAVSYMDNDSFWERVLKTIKLVSSGLTILPGPYGMAAGGVNMLASAMEQLFF